jgi:CBS domain-containing protein
MVVSMCAQVGALSRSFRWGPFLPVRLDDSLLHVLLLLSKHHLQAVPVVAAESEDATVKGFITQDAAVQLLLQCDGLTWFDLIAEKPLSDLGFELEHNSGTLVGVNGDDTLITAFRAMWKHRVSAMPVTDTASKHIIGTLRNTDLLILLDQPNLFNKRREILLKDFLQVETADEKSQIITQGSMEEDLGAVISTTALTLGSVSRPKMTQPVVSLPSDSLKTTMEKLVQSHSNRSFIVDDKGRLIGVITLCDIIMQFAPPLAQAPNQWGGFFESALQQTSSVL